jgi:hypothetical protein
MRGQRKESYSLTDLRGNVFRMDGSLFVLSAGNFGAPPTSYQTRKRYQATGESVLGYQISPRLLSFNLYNPTEERRSDYWAARAEVLAFIRSNRGRLTLTIGFANGNKRSIYVRPDSGLEFAPPEPDEGLQDYFDQAINLIAHDPIWFDPSAASVSPVAATNEEMAIPTMVPTPIGSSGDYFDTGALSYPGTWETYPRIVLDGPFNTATLRCIFMNATIQILSPCATGDSRIITLNPDELSVVDSEGNSKVTELSVDSNLMDFKIVPESELGAGESQSILCIMTGAVPGTSAFTLEYNERYYGI